MDELKEKAEKYLRENCCCTCMLYDDCMKDRVNCMSVDCYVHGYKQAAYDLIAKLADYLQISLTFEDPMIVFNRLMDKA